MMGRTSSQLLRAIWNDPDFQRYGTNEKLLFIYLLGNESVTESGIYRLSSKTAAFHTDLPPESVAQILQQGLLKNVTYDVDTQTVYVRRLRRYNTGGNPELIRVAVAREYQRLSDAGKLWDQFFEDYPEFIQIRGSITVGERLENGSATVPEPFANQTIPTPTPTPSPSPSPSHDLSGESAERGSAAKRATFPSDSEGFVSKSPLGRRVSRRGAVK